MFDPGHVQNVLINYKPDSVTRYIDLSTGAAQFALIEPDNWNLVLANPDKYSYFTMPQWSGVVSWLSLNMNKYPTNITDIRQAIVHAINYSDILAKVFSGSASPIMGP